MSKNGLMEISDDFIIELLKTAGWRKVHTSQSGDEEWTGARDTEAPTLEDLKRLIEVVTETSIAISYSIYDEEKGLSFSNFQNLYKTALMILVLKEKWMIDDDEDEDATAE